jgi:RHS repeat-associated protein
LNAGTWEDAFETLFVYDNWNLIKEMTIPSTGNITNQYYIREQDLNQSIHKAGGTGGLLATIKQGTLDPTSDFDLGLDVDGQDLSELCQTISLADLTQFAEWFGFSSTPEPFTNVYHYCYDANGNVTQLVDAQTGAIKAHYEYDPFGKIDIQTGSAAEDNHFRFSTKYFDQETGLIAYIFRYYDPEMGRWLNRDPFEEPGSVLLRKETEKKKTDLNLYIFVENNPLLKIDHFGSLSIDGMDCTETNRIQAPSISSGEPFASHITGTRVICTDIDISDSLTCVCFGRREKIIEEYYDRFLSWKVEYKCCTKTCPQKCVKRIRIETNKRVGVRIKYEFLPIVVSRFGTTGGAYGYCSECLNGVGKPM